MIIKDLTEKRKFIEKYNCGWILSNPVDDLRDFLKELTLKEIFEKKKGATNVANELNWNEEVEPYLQIVKRYI